MHFINDLPIYFLIISILISISIVWISRRAIRYELDYQITSNLSLVAMIVGLVGARLFHVLYESPEIYLKNPMRIFWVWEGGFVFYGGLLGAIAGGYFYLKVQKSIVIGRYFDLAAPVAGFGYAFGRWACFFSGCCFGKYCELPWSVNHRHPTQLYAFCLEIMSITLVLLLESKPNIFPKRFATLFKEPGKKFALWLLLHGCGRIFMEAFRDDFRGPTFYFSISTWISLILIIFSVRKLGCKTF